MCSRRSGRNEKSKNKLDKICATCVRFYFANCANIKELRFSILKLAFKGKTREKDLERGNKRIIQLEWRIICSCIPRHHIESKLCFMIVMLDIMYLTRTRQ